MHLIEETTVVTDSLGFEHKSLKDTALFSIKSWPVAVAAVLLVGIFLYGGIFGSYPLSDPDEGRYAEIAREMLDTGDFITPRLNYVKYLEKPPLFYWLTAGSMALFGQNERAARAIPALSGFLNLLIVIFLGRAMFGQWTGLAAGWIYLTSLLPFALARLTIIDMLFSMLLTATWASLWMGYSAQSIRQKRGWITLAWACLGLATLTKGPVAIVLTGLVTLLFLASFRKWDLLRLIIRWPGLLVFGIITIPWYAAVGQRNPDFWHFFIVVQHFDRALGNEHVKPFWFFAAALPLGMLFWGPFLFPAAVRTIKSCIQFFKSGLGLSTGAENNEQPGSVLQENGPVLFLGIWIFVVVGLFSLSRCKLIPYILPACPAIALLTAWHIRKALYKRSTAWCLAIIIAILAGMFFAIPYAAGHQSTLSYNEIIGVAHATQAIIVVAIGLLFFSIFRRQFVLPAIGLVLILLFPVMGWTVQEVNRNRKIGYLLKSMPAPLPAEVRIAEWKSYDRSLGFYTHRRIILIDKCESELVYRDSSEDFKHFFLNGENSLKKLADQGPLLVNLRLKEWKDVSQWGKLFPVAANHSNLLVANKQFFDLTKLAPWPEEAIKAPPMLLMPQRAKME